VRYLAASLALVALLAGCGGGRPGFNDAACRAQATKVAEHAGSMLVHYRGGTVYPADMSYLGLRDSLDRYDEGRCADTMLGQKLRRTLTPPERKTLVQLLPRTSAARIRTALAAA
jgi:hypothetical protein